MYNNYTITTVDEVVAKITIKLLLQMPLLSIMDPMTYAFLLIANYLQEKIKTHTKKQQEGPVLCERFIEMEANFRVFYTMLLNSNKNYTSEYIYFGNNMMMQRHVNLFMVLRSNYYIGPRIQWTSNPVNVHSPTQNNPKNTILYIHRENVVIGMTTYLSSSPYYCVPMPRH